MTKQLFIIACLAAFLAGFGAGMGTIVLLQGDTIKEAYERGYEVGQSDVYDEWASWDTLRIWLSGSSGSPLAKAYNRGYMDGYTQFFQYLSEPDGYFPESGIHPKAVLVDSSLPEPKVDSVPYESSASNPTIIYPEGR